MRESFPLTPSHPKRRAGPFLPKGTGPLFHIKNNLLFYFLRASYSSIKRLMAVLSSSCPDIAG